LSDPKDPYVYPGSNVLRNQLGIRDAAQLARLEGDLTYLRGLRLGATGVPGRYARPLRPRAPSGLPPRTL